MKRHSAFTLIETLVTMTAGGAIMVSAMGVLHQSMTLADATQTRLTHYQMLNQLAEQLRRDVFVASQMQLESETRLTLSVDNAEIVYHIVESDIHREQYSEGNRLAAERYKVGINHQAVFESLSDSSQITLMIRRETSLKHAPMQVERLIGASVGRFDFSAASEEDLP